MSLLFFFQAEDGIRDLVRSRGLGDVYKRQMCSCAETLKRFGIAYEAKVLSAHRTPDAALDYASLSLIHI